MKNVKTPLIASASAALLLGLGAQASSASGPFVADALPSGYTQLAEAKCGEAKCGAENAEKAGKEGKCGEAKCGAEESKSEKEGKCGEAKCGAEA